MSHIEIRLFGWEEGGSESEGFVRDFLSETGAPLTSAMFS